jgi:hypothetical protein
MKALWKKSTYRTFSEYGRRALLSQPVVLTSRNLSLDGLIDAINHTRAELAKLQESPILSTEERNRLFSLVLDLKKAFYQIADLCIPK